MPSNLIASRTQHPIGQGFFHSGEVKFDDSVYCYVYDCGSEKRSVLNDSIEEYCSKMGNRSELDALFVSHLDSDHVNGLDQLLSRRVARRVFLPYLSPQDSLILFSQSISDGSASVSSGKIFSDPASWFRDRGTSEIIFVNGGPPRNEDFPIPNDPVIPDKGESIQLAFDTLLGNGQIRALNKQVSSRSAGEYQMSHQSLLPLCVDGHITNWTFLPFVHPETERKEEFLRFVESRFPDLKFSNQETPSDLFEKFCDILRDKKKRDFLANCYKVVFSDRNLTSMSVYSGPLPQSDRFQFGYSAEFKKGKISGSAPAGWIGTGDANLKSKERREAFQMHFENVLSKTMTMTLPHHGSSLSYHEDLANLGPMVFVASAGKKSRYKHPHKEVVKNLRDRKRIVAICNESSSSTLFEKVTVEPT